VSFHREINVMPAKSKSVVIPFSQKCEDERIAEVPERKLHKGLGLWMDSRRRFSGKPAQVLSKCRRAMTWIQSFLQPSTCKTSLHFLVGLSRPKTGVGGRTDLFSTKPLIELVALVGLSTRQGSTLSMTVSVTKLT